MLGVGSHLFVRSFGEERVGTIIGDSDGDISW